MQFAIVAVIAYGLPAAYTSVHLIRTGRSGLNARVRQAAAALLWPAYWFAVHGIATILGRVRATAVEIRLAIERHTQAVARKTTPFKCVERMRAMALERRLGIDRRGLMLWAWGRSIACVAALWLWAATTESAARFARAIARQATHVLRLLGHTSAAAMQACGRGLLAAAGVAWAMWMDSAARCYLKHYRLFRRAGLSRRLTIWFAWNLAADEMPQLSPVSSARRGVVLPISHASAILRPDLP